MSLEYRTIVRTGAVFATAFVALIAGANGEAFASPGCAAVNAGGFNGSVTSGAIPIITKTIANFAVGNTVTFVITMPSGGSLGSG